MISDKIESTLLLYNGIFDCFLWELLDNNSREARSIIYLQKIVGVPIDFSK